MNLPVFDRAADYFRGDDSTLDASTPSELVEELRRADKLWFDCYGYHAVDFSIVDGLYETPGLEAEDMPPGETGAARLGDKVVFFEGRAFLLSGTPREHFPTPELGDTATASSRRRARPRRCGSCFPTFGVRRRTSSRTGSTPARRGGA